MGILRYLRKMEMRRMKNNIQWNEWLYKRVQIETVSLRIIDFKKKMENVFKRELIPFKMKWKNHILFEYEHVNNSFLLNKWITIKHTFHSNYSWKDFKNKFNLKLKEWKLFE